MTDTKIYKNAKKLLTIEIFEDINLPHKVTLVDGTILYTINYIDLAEAIRETIQTRLDVNHQAILEQMKEKGAIKSL